MPKARFFAVFAAFIAALAAPMARADYALPPIKKRFVLLLPGKTVEFQTQGLNVSVRITPVGRTFRVHRGYLQERIASQGLDIGDFSASENRLKDAAEAAKESPNTTALLMELVLLEGEKDFVLSYISLFQAERDFSRYHPKRSVADTIDLGDAEIPESAEAWQKNLQAQTDAAVKQLSAAK